MDSTQIVAAKQNVKRNRYEQIGRNYALSGKEKSDINISDIFRKDERENVIKDIEEVIELYDNMLNENQKEIDLIRVIIEKEESNADQFSCKEGLLVTMRELLLGLLILLINVAAAAILVERKIDLPGIYKYSIALFSPVLMVFLSYLTSNYIVNSWRKMSLKRFVVVLYSYFGICAILLTLVVLDVKYVDVLLYITSLFYPLYLLARIFMVSALVEKKRHMNELKLLRNDIEKSKCDGVAELNGKLSKAIEEDLQNEKDFWIGYASGNSLKF